MMWEKERKSISYSRAEMLCSWVSADAKARSGVPCPVCPCLPTLPLPASVQNLFQKMVLFLIVPKRWFMTVSGGDV